MKKLKEAMIYLGLNPKKELLLFLAYSSIFVLAEVGIILWRGLNFIALFPALSYMAFAFYYFSRYGKTRQQRLERLNQEFVTIFTFFGVFLGDGFTVYDALQKVEEYCSEEFASKLRGLLRGIDEDKSVQPFVDFAVGFEDVAVKEVMLSVYQMVDEGESSVYVHQFQRLFGKLSDTRHALDSAKRLSRLDTLSFLPLCGAGIAMISLTLSVMEIMGGLMDVL